MPNMNKLMPLFLLPKGASPAAKQVLLIPLLGEGIDSTLAGFVTGKAIRDMDKDMRDAMAAKTKSQRNVDRLTELYFDYLTSKISDGKTAKETIVDALAAETYEAALIVIAEAIKKG